MSDSTIVSHSEVESYLSCRKKHYYAFGERLTKPPREGSLNAMEKGTLGHAVMEQFFTARQEGQSYDDAQQVALDYIRAQMFKPMPDYKSIQRVELVTQHFLNTQRERVEGWEVLHLEQEFWLELGDGIKYPFKPDLIVKENGIITLFDYKFVGIMYNANLVALFPQLPKYMGALRAVGVEVTKAAYIFFNMHASLNFEKADANDITRIQPVSINNARLGNSWYEQIATTHEIAEYKKLPLSEWEPRATRSTSKDCDWCTFRDLCTATLQGSDGRIMRETEFVKSTYGYTEKKESDS